MIINLLNITMKHLFVPYEIARQLKEKRFDEDCFTCYNNRGNLFEDYSETCFNGSIDKDWIAAPFYQQVVDWFREKYKIDIYVRPLRTGNTTFTGIYESFINKEFVIESDGYYLCFNKAIEGALKLI